MTLIAVYKSGGDRGAVCVGRCDARCYEATDPKCECICGGRNHGAGKQRALDNTREMCKPWIEEYERKHQLTNVDWSIPAIEPQQAKLF